MLLRDLDEYKEPRRKPWLLLIVMVVLAGIVLQRYRPPAPARDEAPGAAPTHGTSGRQGYVPPSVQKPAPPIPKKPTARVESALVKKQPAPPAPAAAAPRDDFGAHIAEAKGLEKSGAIVAARDKYVSLLQRTRDPRLGAEIEAAIGRLNVYIATHPLPAPEKKEHIVKTGDFIQKIAKTYGTTVELIMKSNSIANANVIRQGDRLMVFNAKLSLTVDKPRNEMILWADNKFFKKYQVGTGKFDRTPTGTFAITEKDKEPVWWKDGKAVGYTGDPKGENILGTRWMTLRATGKTPDVRGYGIHGTWEDDSIGKSESAGCIRMHNSDVEELFMLVPYDTPVTIAD